MLTLGGIRGIRDEDFYFIKDIVSKESGIRLTDLKKSLVQSRVMKRLRELKIYSYEDYCKYLEKNYDDEVVNLINCITTNKTDFFREPKHFEYMRSTLFPEFERARKDKIRIWSAGCSNGAEPYTIAIVVHEYYRGKKIPDIKILACDIDTQVLRKAEEGVYTRGELGNMDVDILKRYFKMGSGENEGLFMVKDSVKKLVAFRRLNLLDNDYPMRGLFDIIFCRNVVIYFDVESRLKLLEKFQGYLADDGYLIMGHSETMAALSNKFSFVGNTIYKKVV